MHPFVTSHPPHEVRRRPQPGSDAPRDPRDRPPMQRGPVQAVGGL